MIGQVDGIQIRITIAIQVQQRAHAVEVGTLELGVVGGDRTYQRWYAAGVLDVDQDAVITGLAENIGSAADRLDSDRIVTLIGHTGSITGIQLGGTRVGAVDVEGIGTGTQPDVEILDLAVIDAGLKLQATQGGCGQHPGLVAGIG